VQELTNERLAGGQVVVGLDPFAADQAPPAVANCLLNRGEKRRIALFDHLEHPGGALVEGEVLAFFHEPDRLGERVVDEVASLVQPPSPDGIHVRLRHDVERVLGQRG
jgi:hypothetical protein